MVFRFIIVNICIAPIVLYSQSKDLTYFGDIKPIIDQHCISCHFDDGAAPFSLTNYDDVAKRAKFIAYVTKISYMPPWKADTNFRHFQNENTLSNSEIALIEKWALGNLKKGKDNRKPKTEFPKFKSKIEDNSSTYIDISMSHKYNIPATNTDDFRFFYLPTNLNDDSYITSLEFIPGNKKRVHHCRLMVDTSGLMSKINGLSEMDEKILDFQKTPLADEFLYGWVPGNFPFNFPKGFGKKINKNAKILLNIHYAPTSVEESDSSKVKITLADKGETMREVFTLTLNENQISNQPFLISADTKPTFYMSSGAINQDISILTVQPHAHLLGKSFRAFAITPDGDMIPLIKIDNWDINWQSTYVFDQLIHIPSGSVILMEGEYDNTIENVNNPNHPAIDVKYGWRTVDEMMNLIFYYVNYQEGDENKVLDFNR